MVMKTSVFFIAVMFTAFLAAGQVRNALDFDGNNDYVSIPDDPSLDITGPITIEAWVNLSSWDNGGCVVTKGTGGGGEVYSLDIHNNRARFYFWVGAAAYTASSSLTIQPNTWNHVVGQYDGSNSRVYLNGTLTVGAAYAGNLNQNNHIVSIGSREATSGTYNLNVAGKIDEVRIWNVARTQQEIRDNAHRELPNPAGETNLVAYYRFNETSGTLVPDISTAGNDGTMTDMDPATDWVLSTAPIPYYSIQNGNWNNNATWAAGQNAPVNAWARVSINNDVTVNSNEDAIDLMINTTGSLTLNSANTLDLSGDFYIYSDAAATGSFIDLGTFSLSGMAYIDRYYGAGDWHFVSSPISDGIAGMYTGMYLQYYDEPSSSWIDIIPTGYPLVPAQGYALYVSSSWTATYTGTPNTGNVSIPVTNAQPFGWNLLGNPYPSALDWDLVYPANSDINGAIYYLDAATGNFLSYNGGMGGGSRYVPPAQGFFVSANTMGNFAVNNAMRSHTGKDIYYKDELSYMLSLEAEGNGYEDAVYMRFDPNSTSGFDGEYDAYKMFSWDNTMLPQIYMRSNEGDNLSINVLPDTDVVPVSFTSQSSGTYTLSLGEVHDFQSVLLEDLLTGMFTELTNSSYTFDFTAGDDPDRFVLHMMVTGIGEAEQPAAKIYSYGRNVYVNLTDKQPVEIAVYTLAGQQVVTETVNANARIPLETSGYYLVKVVGQERIQTRKVFID